MGEGKGMASWPGGWTPPPAGTVPPGFGTTGNPDVPGTTFTNEAGQHIHWGGSGWVNDATGGPLDYVYDPESTGDTGLHAPDQDGDNDFSAPLTAIRQADPLLLEFDPA